MNQYKTCSKCKQIKPLEKYSKHKGGKDGLRAACKDCVNKQTKERHAKNPEKIKAYRNSWRENNRAKVKVYVKEFYARHAVELRAKRAAQRIRSKERENASARAAYLQNPEKYRLKTRIYHENNPEQNRNSSQKRRAIMRNCDTRLVTKAELVKIYGSKCFYCGSIEQITVDHIIPISRGGRHAIGNLAPACYSCNASKNKKTITEWKKVRGW